MTNDQKQRKYDRVHHFMRVKHLTTKENLDAFEVRLLQQSETALSDPSGMASYRSVDLDDVEYLQELDAYEAANRAVEASGAPQP